MSIVLCVSLIAGATFAIFTSESKVNIAVTSGKVDVVATIAEESIETKQLGTEFAEGATNTFAGSVALTAKGGIEIKNFVPGDGVKFNINVVNNSNVNIKYRVVVSDAKGSDLADALEITVNGVTYTGVEQGDYQELEANKNEIKPIPVEIVLPESAGNEWQDKTVELDVTLEAVQGNMDTTQQPLPSFTEDAEYELTGIKANGVDGVLSVEKGTLTINGNGKLVAEGGMYDGKEYAMAVWAYRKDAKVIINGGRYSNTVNYTGKDKEHYDLIYASGGATIEIYGGTFQCVTPKWTLNCKDKDKDGNIGGVIYVMGGRYYQFDPANAQTGEDEIVVPDGYESVKDGEWYEVRPSEKGGESLEDVFYDKVDFGYGSTSTEKADLNGNGVAIANWVDAWVNSDTTIRNVVFKNGAVFSVKADNVTVTLENCTFYACDQTKLTYTGNNSLTNSGAGMCLNLEKSSHTGIKFVVKNCTFIGENDNTLPVYGANYNGDGTINEANPKKRGHAIALDAICGGGTGTLDSLLIEGCVMGGVRGNAIQLYGTTGEITIKDTKINSWGVNSGAYKFTTIVNDVEKVISGNANSAAIRGDYAATRTIKLENVYFGLNEDLTTDPQIRHVNLTPATGEPAFGGNTDGTRLAGTYSYGA